MMHKSIAQALDKYSDGYFALKSIVDKFPDFFPTGVISSGTFAEYYSFLYLRYCYPDDSVVYGHGSQKGWDLSVVHGGGSITRIQVKSTTDFAKKLIIKRPTRGFDQLIVVVLDAGFNTMAAYKFEGEAAVKQLIGYGSLAVPDKRFPSRRGSDIFRSASDITKEFNGVLSEEL